MSVDSCMVDSHVYIQLYVYNNVYVYNHGYVCIMYVCMWTVMCVLVHVFVCICR